MIRFRDYHSNEIQKPKRKNILIDQERYMNRENGRPASDAKNIF